MALLDICCYGVGDALIATQQAAARLELCAALMPEKNL